MSKGSLNVSLKGADDIFSTEESRQEQQREQVQQIPIGDLFPFKNHPFKVLDDESMQRTVESVEQYGVLSPLIARPRPEGGYEKACYRFSEKVAVGSERQSGSFLEQDSTAVPKFAYRSFCPCGNLVGECLPQTLLMRLAPLKNPSKYFFGFFKTVPLHTPFFSY